MKIKNKSVSNALFDTDISIKESKNNDAKHSKSNSKSSNTSTSNISNKVDNTNSKKVRKMDANSTKVNDKSESKHIKKSKTKSTNRKSDKNTNAANTKIESKHEVKVKVGRKTAKNNWWDGCDYVWVDGIDHWVSKTAFRNDDKNNQVYTLNNYVQGLDSFWVLKHKPGTFLTESQKALISINKELKRKFNDWHEVSIWSGLNEHIIEKYKDHILWYELLKNNNISFSDKFKKKFADKFRLLRLVLN